MVLIELKMNECFRKVESVKHYMYYNTRANETFAPSRFFFTLCNNGHWEYEGVTVVINVLQLQSKERGSYFYILDFFKWEEIFIII